MKYLMISLLFLTACSHSPKKEQNLTLSDSLIEETPPIKIIPPTVSKKTPKKTEKNKKTEKVAEELPALAVETVPALPHAWQSGEVLEYKIYVLGIEAGSLSLKTTQDKFKDFPVWKFSGHLYSSGFAGNFYDINATAISLIDLKQLFSYRFSLVSDESSKHKERIEIYSPSLNKSSYYEKITEPNETDRIKKGQIDALASQDILSIFYALRNLEVSSRQQKISVISVDEVVQAEITISDKLVPLKTLQGTKNCILVLATLPRSSEKTTAKIWISNDDSRIVYKIEVPTKIGTAVMELKSLTIP